MLLCGAVPADALSSVLREVCDSSSAAAGGPALPAVPMVHALCGDGVCLCAEYHVLPHTGHDVATGTAGCTAALLRVASAFYVVLTCLCCWQTRFHCRRF